MQKKPRLLFVDDDTALNQLLDKILTEQGYQVDVVTDGQEALQQMLLEHYDVMILDNYLPRMNGIDVLRTVKKQKPQSNIIMITAVNENELAKESMRLGASAVLAKPFDFDQLLNCVREASPGFPKPL
jgi:DNA-binding response OmpR family regulator